MLQTDPPILCAVSLLQQTKIEAAYPSWAFALPQLGRDTRTSQSANESQAGAISEHCDWDKSRDLPAPVPHFSAPALPENRALRAMSVPNADSVPPPGGEASAWLSST